MRLRDLLGGFEVAAAIHEGEGLARPVRAIGLDGHVPGRPAVAAHGTQTPAGRHAILEDREFDDAVSGVDGPNLGMVVIMAMVVMTMVMSPEPADALAGAPDHPNGDAEND